MNQPANLPLNQQGARDAMRALEQKINAVPADVFAKAVRHIEIQAHNAQVDQARAEKKRLKRIRKAGRA
ncbi:MAG TPA: hypothetical protein VIT92_00630 [Burkholderiaceae bacterium]